MMEQLQVGDQIVLHDRARTEGAYAGLDPWSRSERKIARRAFDHALNRELHEVIQKTKQMAAEVKEPSELWGPERYLQQCPEHEPEL